MDIMSLDGRPTLRVLDYKTGKAKTGCRDVAGIFEATSSGAHGYYLQTFLYSLIMSRKETQMPVSPSLFYVLSATDAVNYDPTLRFGKDIITDIRDYADEYVNELRRLLTEIYDSTRPFVQTQDEQKQCQMCDFRRLCGR